MKVPNIRIPNDTNTRNISKAFYFGVSAHAFQWNNAGKINPIGVHVTAPTKDKNFVSFYPTAIVMRTTNATMRVLVQFLLHYLFFDFSHFEYKVCSTTICAG